MMQLKSCPRCHGDMIGEDWLGETELVCIQCGHRMPVAAAAPRYTVVPHRRAPAPANSEPSERHKTPTRAAA